MNAHRFSLILGLLVLFSSALMARVEKKAEGGKLIVTHYAADGNVFIVETTEKTDENTFKTTIKNGKGDVVGTVVHTVLETRTGTGGATYMITKNEHYDANGNYTKTTYAVFIFDANGVLVNIIYDARLDNLLELGKGDGTNYDSLTSGADPGGKFQ